MHLTFVCNTRLRADSLKPPAWQPGAIGAPRSSYCDETTGRALWVIKCSLRGPYVWFKWLQQCRIFTFNLDLRKLQDKNIHIYIIVFIFTVQVWTLLLRRFVSYVPGSPSTTQHFLLNIFSAGVGIHQQSVGFTGPLLTYMGHPRDLPALFWLMTSSFWGFCCLRQALTPVPQAYLHTHTENKKVEVTTSYCYCFNDFKSAEMKTNSFIRQCILKTGGHLGGTWGDFIYPLDCFRTRNYAKH